MRRSFVPALLAASASLLAADRRAQLTRAPARRPASARRLLHPRADIQGHTCRTSTSPASSTRRAATAARTWVYVALSQTGIAKRRRVDPGHLEVWLGTSCNDINLRGGRCKRLSTTTVTAFLNESAGASSSHRPRGR
jgi:hypothetical protein